MSVGVYKNARLGKPPKRTNITDYYRLKSHGCCQYPVDEFLTDDAEQMRLATARMAEGQLTLNYRPDLSGGFVRFDCRTSLIAC